MAKSRTAPTESATPDPTPPPSAASAVAEPTPPATAQLATDQAARDAADLAAALAHLESYRVNAEPNIAPRLALRAEAAPFLTRALAEDLGVLAAFRVPEHLRTALEQAIRPVSDDAKAADYGPEALEEMRTLPPAACRKSEYHLQANRWPRRVEEIRDKFLAAANPLEDVRKNLRNLQEVHARIDGWVAGERMRGGCQPPRMATESRRDEPLRTELAFNPMKTP